jgi:hypothetical protein
VDAAPKASGCFWGGKQEIFFAVSGDLLGGTGKAEDAKLPDAGISSKQCQENEQQKKAGLLNWEHWRSTSRDMWAGKAEEKKSALQRSPQVRKWCSI